MQTHVLLFFYHTCKCETEENENQRICRVTNSRHMTFMLPDSRQKHILCGRSANQGDQLGGNSAA